MVHLPSTLTGAALGRGSCAVVRGAREKSKRSRAVTWYLRVRDFIFGSWCWFILDFMILEELISRDCKKRRQDAGATGSRRGDLADMGRSEAAPLHGLWRRSDSASL